MMYKQDHNDRAPPSFDDLKKAGATDDIIHAEGCQFQLDASTGTVTDLGHGEAAKNAPNVVINAPTGGRRLGSRLWRRRLPRAGRVQRRAGRHHHAAERRQRTCERRRRRRAVDPPISSASLTAKGTARKILPPTTFSARPSVSGGRCEAIGGVSLCSKKS